MSKPVFDNPARFELRLEQADKDWIKENTDNMTEFVNRAIKNEIERVQG